MVFQARTWKCEKNTSFLFSIHTIFIVLILSNFFIIIFYSVRIADNDIQLELKGWLRP